MINSQIKKIEALVEISNRQLCAKLMGVNCVERELTEQRDKTEATLKVEKTELDYLIKRLLDKAYG